MIRLLDPRTRLWLKRTYAHTGVVVVIVVVVVVLAVVAVVAVVVASFILT
jgi:hypothetical protein